MSHTTVPRVPRAPRKTYAQLQEENRDLRERLERLREERGEVRFSAEKQLLMVDELKTPDFVVDRMTVSTPAMDQAMAMFSADTLSKNGGKPDLGGLKALGQTPVKIQELKVRVPQSTVTRLVKEHARHPNLKELNVTLGDQGSFEASGVAHKWVDLPFHVSGMMEATDDGQVRVRLKDGKVFGMVPIPKIIMGMVTSMAGDKVDKVPMKKEGDDLLIDPSALVPNNIEFNLNSVTTHKGELIVAGGCPVTEEPPKVIAMGPWGPRPTE